MGINASVPDDGELQAARFVERTKVYDGVRIRCYRKLRENIATEILHLIHNDGKKNPADYSGKMRLD